VIPPNVVLDDLPTIVMDAIDLPPGLLHAIEGLRRSFLWNVKGTNRGTKGLVAWSDVCRPKEGYQTKMNACNSSLCTVSISIQMHLGRVGCGLRYCGANGSHWKKVAALLPIYRAITGVRLGNGRHIAFWLDTWLRTLPLCYQLPALFLLEICPRGQSCMTYFLMYS
jgi:hypothetical protein